MANKNFSAVSSKKMIVQGTDAYLAYIMDRPETRSEISQVLIVRDFLDVFPKKLLGMPPKREIEFSVELEPRIAPISCTAYRMAAVELKELREQL